MRKIRVYELAKEAGMDSKDLTAKLIEMGYSVKAYNSTLDEETAADVRQKLGFVKVDVKETRIQTKGKTTIIRRRSKVVPEPAAKPEPVAEEEAPQEDVAAPADAAAEAVNEAVETAESEGAPEETVSAEAPQAEESKEAEEAVAPVEETQPHEAEARTEVPEEEEKPVQSESEATQETVKKEPAKPKKSGYAKIVGQAVLPIQDEAPTRRPKKKDKKKARTDEGFVQPRQPVAPDAADAGRKGKKGKRIVKFTTDNDHVRKGGIRRKNQGDVEAADLDGFGGRLSTKVKVGRGPRGGKRGKQRAVESSTIEMKASKKKIAMFEAISVGDLAHKMGVKANEVIGQLMGMGMMATVNQAIDFDTASLVAGEFGYEVEQKFTEEQSILDLQEQQGGGKEVPRPPVVTVMGHVDHGKTSILDAIRKTDVAAGEAGGITQHIGAHYVRSAQGDLVFLDTPGHAAFTEMRSRGAQVTDVVVLVVAADDGVMDQTREAINHAKAAGVPILVAVNKIDKDNADPMRVMSELADYELIPEEWGGDTIFCKTSAETGEGIEELVESILLQTEVLELKADPKRKAAGHVIEAQLHKGRGPLATILVQQGTLHQGDCFVVGDFYGKVRSMHDDKGKIIDEAGPATPVEVQGLAGVPMAGDEFVVVNDEKMAKNVAQQRQMKKREIDLAAGTKISLDNLFEKLQEGDMKELCILLRSDVQGTLEAFSKAVEKLSTDEIKVKILHAGTGTITTSDVLLAAASDALIIAFNVRPTSQVTELAKSESVDLRTYDVIYHALEDIEAAMVGMLEPTYEEEVIGSAEVREVFSVPKVGNIAGCMVVSGRVERNAGVRLVRDGVVVYTGKISSLRRVKDDVKEVQNGYECGIGLENFNDVKRGDMIEAYIMNEVARTL
ncbi:MAG: translation initiation factor IF-2 [Desulfobulbaceae bacterium]|nr:MAG: translation initiation factor IF-2 [Desulfobulbaceae bacterium]